MNTLVIVSISVLLIGVFWLAVLATSRILSEGARLRLRQAMELVGIAAPQPQDRGEAQALGSAARQCAACPAQVQCDLLLAQRDWKTLRTFCPNRGYVEGLLRRRPAAP